MKLTYIHTLQEEGRLQALTKGQNFTSPNLTLRSQEEVKKDREINKKKVDSSDRSSAFTAGRNLLCTLQDGHQQSLLLLLLTVEQILFKYSRDGEGLFLAYIKASFLWRSLYVGL